MEPVLDILREHDLIRNGVAQEDAFQRLSQSVILDLARALSVAQPDERTHLVQRSPTSPFVHAASGELGGGIQSCMALPCRLSRLDSLARFAALYSDRVYLRNYFSGYDGLADLSTRELRFRFLDDVKVLMSIAPLLESGLISLVAPTSCMCPSCFNVIDPALRKKLAEIEIVAAEILREKCIVSVRRRKKTYEVEVVGPVGLTHSLVVALEDLDVGCATPDFLRAVTKRENVDIPEEIIIEVLKSPAYNVVADLGYQAATALEYGAGFITGSEVQVSLQTLLTGKNSSERQVVSAEELVLSQLMVELPYLSQVPLSMMMRLRENHEESFVRFRHALRLAATELPAASARSDRVLGELKADVVDPELAKVDLAVRAERNRLVGRAVPALVSTGVVGVGMALGMASGEPLAGFAAGLIASQTTEAIKQAVQARIERAQPDQSDFYFLWKVRQQVQKH